MICSACRYGGALAQANRSPQGTLSAEWIDASLAVHAKCAGLTWCDCQHQVTGVNSQLVSPGSVAR
jgi:hypothetical protein